MPLHPLWAFVACSMVNFSFTLPFINFNWSVIILNKAVFTVLLSSYYFPSESTLNYVRTLCNTVQFYVLRTNLIFKHILPSTIKLHVQVFLRMNTWMFETCRRHYS